jgi:hypothetical protein
MPGMLLAKLEGSRAMDMYGSIANNLASAVRSARRLNGYPVHMDTLNHWRELLQHARREDAQGSAESLDALIVELEYALVNRG